ncbi:hypothetical protein [Sphingomonas mali]|uniref:hypothetical protein n=1 Tax=Sphingomonas mali TaxID=40682 RepID=UPI00082CE478|nr:hypothetical protein [Sphingomonas mali]
MKSFLLVGLLLQVFALPTLCAFAWFRGGVTERRVATALFIAVVATTTTDAFGTRWQGPNWAVITVDVILMAVLVVIARQSTRFWPIWTAASQLGGCLAHLPAILNPEIPKHLYGATQPFWVWPLMMSLLIGVLSVHRLRRMQEKSGGPPASIPV